MNQNNIREILEGHDRVPVVTFGQEDDPVAFMQYLLEEGVKCIEITLRTEFGLPAIRAIRFAFGPEVVVGAGTVLDPSQLPALNDAGTDFLVSPGATDDLIDAMEASGMAYLPGAVTPSEIMHLRSKGMRTLKFFPAHLFGGKDALKAYGQLFPDVAFCPTGGIKKETSGDYLSLSNVFAVGGSWFQKDYQRRA
jgi:2-dehydro-3-deoxyphosphogluconate aldolase/(4S)-4-hydroxy-2-oxoglutarate aldolase